MSNADRLIELFNGAQDLLAGTVRDAYLAEECGDDAELMAQVISLVEAHESAGGFLQTGLERSPEIQAQLARLTPEVVGQEIGPYKLREQIGEGGFGTVWVA
ncbi:MAG: serine/threonine protein kinase, partial [Verrucomicrobiota bacterium]